MRSSYILIFYILISTSCCRSESHTRHLLQFKSECPFDFSSINYTSITSVCREPYKAEPCCGSLTNLTCNYGTYINDLNTTCADNFFAYLNNAGNYPGGLFSNLCVGNDQGLPCPLAPSPPSSAVQSFTLASIFLTTLLELLAYLVLS